MRIGVTGQRDAAEQMHRAAEKHVDVVDLIPKASMSTILIAMKTWLAHAR